jgi:hypothetical protein
VDPAAPDRAAKQTGDSATAPDAYGKLVALSKPVGPARPELTEARITPNELTFSVRPQNTRPDGIVKPAEPCLDGAVRCGQTLNPSARRFDPQSFSAPKQLHALIGGFHLGPATSDYTDQIVTELKTFAPDSVVPMHCSGQTFVDSVQKIMPDRLLLASAAARLNFGA